MAVSISALGDDHIPQIIAACADWKELAQYGPPYWRPRSPAELRRKVAATAGPQPATEYSFVLSTGAGELVGEGSIHAIDWRNGVAQVGLCIWQPGERRQGYGQAAAQYLIDWGFGYLGLNRLEAWIVDGNDASVGLFRRFGFAHEATLRQRYLHAGNYMDMHVLSRIAPAPPSVGLP